jgi:hypothetical protein
MQNLFILFHSASHAIYIEWCHIVFAISWLRQATPMPSLCNRHRGRTLIVTGYTFLQLTSKHTTHYETTGQLVHVARHLEVRVSSKTHCFSRATAWAGLRGLSTLGCPTLHILTGPSRSKLHYLYFLVHCQLYHETAKK